MYKCNENSVSASSKIKVSVSGEYWKKWYRCIPNVYHGVASPLLFKTVYYTSGHRDYKLLEFWCWNLVPFLPDIGFQLLKSLWSSLMYFSFNDVTNVLYRWKIWTAGRPIQHQDSSTMKPCCCNSCSMWFCIVLMKYTFVWRGEYVALKPLYTFQYS